MNHPIKTPGKTTPKLDIAYKNLTYGGKVEGKSLFSFGDQAEAFKVMATAVHGDVFDVTVVKNTAGYNDWVTVKKSEGTSGSTVESTGAAAPSSYTPKSAPLGGSTYATAEERAKTQIYIVRQSNITAAINLLSIGSKSPPKLDDILNTAKVFENHVFGTSSDTVDVPKPPIRADDLPEDDIPF